MITNSTPPLADVSALPNIGDFMWYVSDIFTMGVQYGGRTDLCARLNSTFFSNVTSGEFNYTAFGEYATMKNVFIEDYDARSLAKTTLNTTNAIRQWTW